MRDRTKELGTSAQSSDDDDEGTALMIKSGTGASMKDDKENEAFFRKVQEIREGLEALKKKVSELENKQKTVLGVALPEDSMKKELQTLRDEIKVLASQIHKKLKTGNDVSDEQLETMLESGQTDVFTQNILGDAKATKMALNEIETRHEEILKLERSIKDLHDMFQYLAMEVEAQVVFVNILRSYQINVPVKCCYTLTGGLKPNTRDWIGIFKVGWKSAQRYYNYKWVQPSLEQDGPEPLQQEVVFSESYLPKDDGEFYQFCYVDSSGQVRGASTPFCFQNPAEASLDCSLDKDLLVITTQVDLQSSQKEIKRLQSEKLAMKGELDELRPEIKELRATLSQQSPAKGDKGGIKAQLNEAQRRIKEQAHVAEMVQLEKENLAKVNQKLKDENERLQKVVFELQVASVAAASQHQNNPLSPLPSQLSTAPISPQLQDQAHSHYYESINNLSGVPTDTENKSRVCRHCCESFPDISEDELEIHEQSHKVCPFCTLICDEMKQQEFEDHVYSHEE
ncbi:hypothetical protein P4O66_001451 [Electrophorus voltai]|uniref:Uncharacterized protein n=1 Tax=Electrophorus voltai TaxID=2609070 RepID=A0AAD9DTT8_9TELE|nr:hypothetical protein P4O66_001451 [Electrophorus voltai]